MFNYKACHNYGLDLLIFEYLIPFLSDIEKTFNFFIFDYVFYTEKPSDFYIEGCDSSNTWNYDLKYESTSKDVIMRESQLFNFGNYDYSQDDDTIIVKARGHIYTRTTYGQAHSVTRKEYESKYDKSMYIGQRILSNKDHTELNIFVVRNLTTRELNLLSVMCYNDVTININRKYSDCRYEIVDNNVLTQEEMKNFIDYVNYIHLDYGRIELIKDDKSGWCIIDVNNSPGKGPISDMVYKHIGDIFLKIMKE